ncbi:alpha-amylase family protein [Paenibacillus sp.]|uniref:alpha-amylase family protein n=1 Tax=Paenibacillus sp. TaxID=58172 RepID=UPI002D2D2EC8|nr:alpha-amylase family protein [Paenibacillus sp.]HZG86715.1 alpha-amylase family protein [Paenibacillus sp.]
MPWWSNNRLRLIQNNLRESDANLDVDALIKQLKELHANVLMINAGGIVAFYPTKLEYQYRAAGQQKDLVREALDKAHAEGMKVIVRFDFSKAHESIFEKKPEWFYRTKEGREVNYHGIVHSCISSYYQQEYSLKIIDEVLTNYDVDGIFFNWFGYNTRDYSGNDHGICHCEACKTKFRERFGLELPEQENRDDPAFLKHLIYREETAAMMLDRVHALVKSKNRDIAISTYSDHKVDIIRAESNTDKARPHPVWLYSASENVKAVEDSWDDKLISNCVINAVDLVHRFNAVSKHEINIRLKEALASGSGLDFCIIGVFEDYPDRENLPIVADIFAYHEKHQEYYGNFTSVSEIALVKPRRTQSADSKEYAGLFKMLKEEHVLFDVVQQKTLPGRAERLSRYKTILIPDIAEFSAEELEALESYSAQGGCLIATGRSFTSGEPNRSFLQRTFGVQAEEAGTFRRQAAYLYVGDKETFRRFPERDWLLLDGHFGRVRFGAACRTHLPLVEPSTFGPPERAFGHRISDDVFGLGVHSDDRRTSVYMPWQPGQLYYKHGYDDNKRLLLDVLDRFVQLESPVIIEAPQTVELFFNRLDDETYILHLLNLSGFNGVSYFEPTPIHNVRVRLPRVERCKQLISLVDDATPVVAGDTDGVTLTLPVLRDFAAVVLKV